MNNLILIVLTSSVVSAVITALLTFLFQFILKKLDHKNTYYSKIIDKRLKAYEYLENQIAVLKHTAVDFDGDKQAYHLIFGYTEKQYYDFQQNLAFAMANSLWINDSTIDEMQKLNRLFLFIGNTYNLKTDLIKAGKSKYHELSEIRKNLEELISNDLLELHKVKKFIKNCPIRVI